MKFVVVLLLVTAMFGAGLSPTGYAAAACSPNAPFDLYAESGIATIYGSTSINFWGYSKTAGTPSLPGPVLEVNAGDCVQVTLHNNLSEPSALLFQGQSMIPDTVGAAAGGTKVYTFEATNPGTFLYEAGLTPNGQHQVAMGLYGALIVLPATAGQAYNDPSTAYTSENVLVLSEVDTALNNSASPATFDMRNFSPRYFLINGKAYPDTAALPVVAGDTVLMRYVNAGLQAHSMSTLGLSQAIIAEDGHPHAFSHKVIAETIATGQTLDTLVKIPASAGVGDKYALYDANMLLRNSSGTYNSGMGGMFTIFSVGTGTPPPPTDSGPSVSNLTLSPNPTNGSGDVTVNATVTDSGITATNIHAAEFYIDNTAGSPNPMTGAFDTSTSISVSGTILQATLLGLSSGNHTIYVRGQDANLNWGPFLSVTLNLDKTGPTTSGLTLSPNPSSGAVSVNLSGTANDSTSGNSNVTAAEYWVDSGAHTPITIASPAPSVNFTATIPAGLSMGTHVVSVRSQDAFGNWGAVATINLQVADTAAPTTSNVVASPNPNNGFQGYNTSTPAVRVTANFSDVATGGSNIVAAEGFIDTVGTTGTGFVFIATDGSFNSPSESGYSDIPLAVIGSLSNGNHTIYVHAKDAAGNWGTNATTILVINKSLYFSTSGTTNPPGVGGTADDADIYLWNGAFSRVLDASATPYSLPSGANVDGFDRVDATHFYMSFTGNVTLPIGTVADEDVVYYDGTTNTWSLFFDGSAHNVGNTDLDAISIVNGTLYFSTDNTAVPQGAGGTGDDADIYRWNGGNSYTRVFDASALGGSTDNVDGLVWVDTTHFYLSYSVDTTVPGLGTVQDEDVVYYNAGTWLVYFDGTANGLTNNNQDIDAFDIP